MQSNLPTETVAAIAVAAMLASCTVADTPNAREKADIASKITYIKDGHGICYAAVSSFSYGFNQIASIAAVPCEKVGL